MSMQYIDIDFLNQLKEPYKNYTTFIETGTFEGNTTFSVAKYFDMVHTIEIKEELYNKTKSQNKFDNITFHLGDSSEVFKTLLPTITNNSILFLDGHYSSGITGRGKKDCPLNEEIDIINNLFNHQAIIIIDDFRLFGVKRNEDWSYINKNNIISKLAGRLTQYYHLPSVNHEEDRLVLHINKL